MRVRVRRRLKGGEVASGGKLAAAAMAVRTGSCPQPGATAPSPCKRRRLALGCLRVSASLFRMRDRPAGLLTGFEPGPKVGASSASHILHPGSCLGLQLRPAARLGCVCEISEQMRPQWLACKRPATDLLPTCCRYRQTEHWPAIGQTRSPSPAFCSHAPSATALEGLRFPLRPSRASLRRPQHVVLPDVFFWPGNWMKRQCSVCGPHD